jgi:hypothetical protein
MALPIIRPSASTFVPPVISSSRPSKVISLTKIRLPSAAIPLGLRTPSAATVNSPPGSRRHTSPGATSVTYIVPAASKTRSSGDCRGPPGPVTTSVRPVVTSTALIRPGRYSAT